MWNLKNHTSKRICKTERFTDIESKPVVIKGEREGRKNKLAVQDSVQFSSVQFRRSVMPDSLQSHELQHARPPCPSPTPGVQYRINRLQTTVHKTDQQQGYTIQQREL